MNEAPKDLLAGWSPTEPPPHVRERVLAAARRGAFPARRALEDRLWENRSVRIAWLAAAAALVALNLWLPAPEQPLPRPSPLRRSTVEIDPVLASLIAKRPPTRVTWSDQSQLVLVLLDEARSAATNATADGGRP